MTAAATAATDGERRMGKETVVVASSRDYWLEKSDRWRGGRRGGKAFHVRDTVPVDIDRSVRQHVVSEGQRDVVDNILQLYDVCTYLYNGIKPERKKSSCCLSICRLN